MDPNKQNLNLIKYESISNTNSNAEDDQNNIYCKSKKLQSSISPSKDISNHFNVITSIFLYILNKMVKILAL